MTSADGLIAAAKEAVGDEARADAADLAIEEALRAGWNSALVGRLINDYAFRFRRRTREDRVRRHLALTTAVCYSPGLSSGNRDFYVEAALMPTPVWTATAGEFWSNRFALRVEKDGIDHTPDFGGGLSRRRALLEDEENLDARAMLDAADRLLEAARPKSREQFRLLLDRAHALLILSEGGTRPGALLAARRSLGRAEGWHDDPNVRNRGGHARLELLLLRTHDALGEQALPARGIASALLAALDGAIAADEDLTPIVANALRHFEVHGRGASVDTAAHAALLRRLLGLKIPDGVRAFFVSCLWSNLWARVQASGEPALAEEALAIGRRLHGEGRADDHTLAFALMRTAEMLVDVGRARALLEEASTLQSDPQGQDAAQRGLALAHSAVIGGGTAPAFEAIRIAVEQMGSTGPQRRMMLAMRERAVRALIDLVSPAALAELGALIDDAEDEYRVDAELRVAFETECALANGTVHAKDAARHLYECARRYSETTVVPTIRLLMSPAGAAFPLLSAAAEDIPAFAAAMCDVLDEAPWSASVASVLADLAARSPHAEHTEARAMRLLETALVSVEEPTERKHVRNMLGIRLLARFDRVREAADDSSATSILPSDDLDRAIELILPDRQKRDDLDSGLRRRLLDSLDMRLGFGTELDKLRSFLLQDTVYDEEEALAYRLRAALYYQHHWANVFWGVVWGPFGPLAGALERELDRARPEILEGAQGLASRSAYAAAASGRVVLAVEIAERGQGLLAARALQRLGRPTSGLHVDHGRLHGAWADASMRLGRAVESSLPALDEFKGTAPSRPPTRLLERTEALAELAQASAHLAELIAEEERTRSDLEAAAGFVVLDPDIATIVTHLHRRGAQLSYLVASTWGGRALTVRRDGSIAVTDLPGLTEQACVGWQRTLVESTPGGALRDAVVRGPETQPDLADADAVLTELSEALRPLADELARRGEPVELVPTGRTAMLPVTAALQYTRDDDGWLEISTAASARLHLAAESRARLLNDADRITAITDPAVDTADGVLPPLAYAAREGERLSQRYGGEHYTGETATAALARLALRERHRVLHFAVHGASDVDDPAMSRVYLAGGEGRTADPLTAGEMSQEIVSTRLVYLGACWTGRPGARLPQEAIGFPTLLLQSGAGGVVAPLWPVEDGASFTFASAFYRSWLDEGHSTARAVADAMRTTRQRHPSTPTWAAFSLYGV